MAQYYVIKIKSPNLAIYIKINVYTCTTYMYIDKLFLWQESYFHFKNRHIYIKICFHWQSNLVQTVQIMSILKWLYINIYKKNMSKF